jgi:hypothetical protein
METGVTALRCTVTMLASLLLPACGGAERPGATARSDSADASASPGGAGEVSPAPTDRPPLRDPVPLQATADVDGTRYRYSGVGECQHTEDASIYQVPASMWSARFTDEAGSLTYLNLTLWRPKGTAGVQVSLALTGGGETSRISTVRGAEVHGSGSGRVEPKGEGGSLVVDGRDAGGHGVKLTVDCSRFTEPVAEGG